jgi:uncharacterized SAM-binding protein YcdF (DUF218 family)
LTRFLENLLLPPAGLVWLGLAGLVLLAFPARRRWATALMAAAVSGLYVLSTPLAGTLILESLDRYPPLPESGALPEAECIVILGAGLRWGPSEYGGDTVTDLGLERLRYGARLAERTGRPVLVTGMSAEEMAEAMATSFHAEVAWKAGGVTTRDNAVRTAEALLPAGIRRIYLVTHYWHMPRSVAVFHASGFETVPAPLGFSETAEGAGGIGMLLPRSGPLASVNRGLHEWIGRLWYRMRYGA